MGYVIAVVLIVVSIFSMWASALALRSKDYATVQRGGGGARPPRHASLGERARLRDRVPDPGARPLAASRPAASLLATVWSFSPLPDAYTLAHYGRVFSESSIYIRNTLLYATLAGLIDVMVGGAIAYLVLRTKLIGRHWLDWAASAALAVPGVVLGIGYLRTFYNVQLPDGRPLAGFWVMIVLALAIRRLPYALRACHAALQQISVALEEAAENSGPPRRGRCAGSSRR